jgi:hypothetical protein
MDKRQKVQDKLEQTKADIAEKLEVLGERAERVRTSVSLQHHMEQRPWVVLGGSVLAGMALARLMSPRSMPRIAAAIANAAWLSAAEPLKRASTQLQDAGKQAEQEIRKHTKTALRHIDSAAEYAHQELRKAADPLTSNALSDENRRSTLKSLNLLQPFARTVLWGLATAFLKQMVEDKPVVSSQENNGAGIQRSAENGSSGVELEASAGSD